MTYPVDMNPAQPYEDAVWDLHSRYSTLQKIGQILPTTRFPPGNMSEVIQTRDRSVWNDLNDVAGTDELPEVHTVSKLTRCPSNPVKQHRGAGNDA